MPRHKVLTFANVASAAALVIATSAGGFSVAAGLGKNVVGSSQIKKGAVKSVDVKDDGLTGKDIKESALGTVPLAATAATAAKAAEVDTVSTKRVTANPGQTVPIATNSTLVAELTCVDGGGGILYSQLNVRTTADHAAFNASLNGSQDGDFNVADGPIDIAIADGTSQDIEDGGFSAVTAGGVSWKGYGWVIAHRAGANTCMGELTFFG